MKKICWGAAEKTGREYEHESGIDVVYEYECKSCKKVSDVRAISMIMFGLVRTWEKGRYIWCHSIGNKAKLV